MTDIDLEPLRGDRWTIATRPGDLVWITLKGEPIIFRIDENGIPGNLSVRQMAVLKTFLDCLIAEINEAAP